MNVAPLAAVVFAADVGGSKVRVVLADLAGTVLVEAEAPTRGDDAAAFAEQLRGMRDALCDAAGRAAGDLRAAGLALPVTIDPSTGAIASTHNVPGLTDVRVGEVLASALGVRVALGNDADLAALAEGRHGVAVGARDFVVIAIGTGIGMGIVADGRLVRGTRGRAGEVGFLPLGVEPATAVSRRAGAFEIAAAGPALRRRIDAAVAGSRPTVLRRGAGLADVIAAADIGDPVAVGLLAEEASIVALGVAAVTAVLDPTLVVLGGGVGATPGFAAAVGDSLASLVADPPRVATSGLGDRGPLLGAIDLAIDLAIDPAFDSAFDSGAQGDG